MFVVRRADGPDWIARVFSADRPRQAVEDDAEVLRLVAPTASRCRCSAGSGVRDDLVDAAVVAYVAHQPLTPDEVGRLVDAIRGFSVVLAGWMVVTYPAFAANTVDAVHGERRIAEAIAERVGVLLGP